MAVVSLMEDEGGGLLAWLESSGSQSLTRWMKGWSYAVLSCCRMLSTVDNAG